MLIEADNVTRMFGQKAAVDRMTFTLDRPAFLGIIGRSGAGKSTFLRMMNRLTDATSGAIHVEGRDVRADRPRHARLAKPVRDDLPAVQPRPPDGCRVERAARHAEPPLDPRHDVQPLVRRRHHTAPSDILDRLGIAEQATKRAEALSGGQQQRVAIARALMQDPKIDPGRRAHRLARPDERQARDGRPPPHP